MGKRNSADELAAFGPPGLPRVAKFRRRSLVEQLPSLITLNQRLQGGPELVMRVSTRLANGPAAWLGAWVFIARSACVSRVHRVRS